MPDLTGPQVAALETAARMTERRYAEAGGLLAVGAGVSNVTTTTTVAAAPARRLAELGLIRLDPGHRRRRAQATPAGYAYLEELTDA